jgi:hypothetical protein
VGLLLWALSMCFGVKRATLLRRKAGGQGTSFQRKYFFFSEEIFQDGINSIYSSIIISAIIIEKEWNFSTSI